jgi:hypothetical protein
MTGRFVLCQKGLPLCRQDATAADVNVELGKKLGRDMIELPDGHVGYVTQPAEFARKFVQAFAGTGHGRKA